MQQLFLPITAEEVTQRGWDAPDFVYVVGEAYVDHPSFGLAIISSRDPSDLQKELIAIAIGIVIFLLVGWCLRDLERAKKIRYLAAAAGLALLAFNLVFGVEKFGAKNWIQLGSFSFQRDMLVTCHA